MSAPEEMTLKVIAHIRTAFPTKFGIPRQSGLVDSLRGEVIFTPEYRSPASAATPGWAYLPPARPSGPIRWGCPASSWKPSSTGLTSAPSSSCGAPT